MTCNHHWELEIPNLSKTHVRKQKGTMNLYKCTKCGSLMSAEKETIEIMNSIGDIDDR